MGTGCEGKIFRQTRRGPFAIVKLFEQKCSNGQSGSDRISDRRRFERLERFEPAAA